MWLAEGCLWHLFPRQTCCRNLLIGGMILLMQRNPAKQPIILSSIKKTMSDNTVRIHNYVIGERMIHLFVIPQSSLIEIFLTVLLAKKVNGKISFRSCGSIFKDLKVILINITARLQLSESNSRLLL